MLAAHLVEHLARQPSASMGYIVQPLANRLVYIRSRRDIQEPLIGCRVLHNCGGSALYREHTGRLLFRSCFMKSPERRRKAVRE